VRQVLAALTAVAVAAAPLLAQAGPDPKRKVAVLEYREGSTALPGIEGKIATLLAKQTSLDVIDADEARKAYGGKLDADVVACGGEDACIAKIGAKVGAKEVLLVGVSEFGDVILTLQRVDVKKHAVAMRIAEALAEDDDPGDDALGGYLKRVMPESDFLRYGMIKVSANLTGAEVYVGDTFRGTTPVDAMKVRAPSKYEVKLTKKGFVPFTARVSVPPDGEVEVAAHLTKVGAGGGAWYTKWWVAAIAGVVVAGGIGLGVWATEGDPSSVPVGGQID
jgi:hypothetical protein